MQRLYSPFAVFTVASVFTVRLDRPQGVTRWSVREANRIGARDPPWWWLLFVALLVPSYATCSKLLIGSTYPRAIVSKNVVAIVGCAATCLICLLLGRQHLSPVSTSPIRKWLGIRAVRSFGSDEMGVIGRKFRMASISIRYIFIASNVSNWFPTIFIKCFFIDLTTAFQIPPNGARVVGWNATLPAPVLDNREC